MPTPEVSAPEAVASARPARLACSGHASARTSTSSAAAIGTLRTQNSALRTEVQRLKEDPAMIEAIARRELGLLRRGEVLIVVKN